MSLLQIIGKQFTGIQVCRRYLLTLYFIMSVVATNWAQFISNDNYSGNWSESGSWIGGEAPGTSINGVNIDCYGWLTANNCLDFNNGEFRIHDTLVVYGVFTLLNSSQLFIEPGGILIVFGDYNSNNKVEVENSGYLIVTGEFKMLGSDNQGFFRNTGGKVFLFDDNPEIKGGTLYSDLACNDTSDFPVGCGYGNEMDLSEDPISDFFFSFNYDENDTTEISCLVVMFEADRFNVCQSDTITFYDQSAGISDDAEYSWDFGDGAYPRVITGIGPHEVVYDTPGWKDVELIVNDEVLVNTLLNDYVYVAEVPDLEMEDASRCGTGEVLFYANSERADIVQFSTDGGTTIFHETSVAPFECLVFIEEWQRAILWAKAMDTTTGCMSGWDQTAMGWAYPVPSVQIVGDSLLCNDEDLLFTTNDYFTRYLWHDGSAGDSYTTYKEEEVTVTVWNDLGCQDSDSLSIVSCEEYNPFAASIYSFTPNADGLNDYWIIDDIESYPEAKIWVYNASGNLVYYSPGRYQNNWDGIYNGKKLPIDSYYFMIDYSKYNKGALTGIVTIVYVN